MLLLSNNTSFTTASIVQTKPTLSGSYMPSGVCGLIRAVDCSIKGPECAFMEGLNFPITLYSQELSSIMETPVEQFIQALRSSGATTNPVDAAKPLK